MGYTYTIKSKRSERSSSSTISCSSPLEAKKVKMMDVDQRKSSETTIEDVARAIKVMNGEMSENFSKLNEEIAIFRHEVKTEVQELNNTIKELEKSLENAWAEIDGLKEEAKIQKELKNAQQKEIDALKEEIKENKKKLEDERENIIQIKNYTRRENLKIMNIPELEEEGKSFEAKDVVYSILQNELGIDTADIRFHVVHRIGKPKRNKIRPLIVRFVCREDRDHVFSRRQQLKRSDRYQDAYMTADFARAIQEERRKLIKAMYVARDKGHQAKVINRDLFVDGEKKTSPTFQKNSPSRNIVESSVRTHSLVH